MMWSAMFVSHLLLARERARKEDGEGEAAPTPAKPNLIVPPSFFLSMWAVTQKKCSHTD